MSKEYVITDVQVAEIRDLAFRITDGAACDPAGTSMMAEIEKERDRVYEILDGLPILTASSSYAVTYRGGL